MRQWDIEDWLREEIWVNSYDRVWGQVRSPIVNHLTPRVHSFLAAQIAQVFYQSLQEPQVVICQQIEDQANEDLQQNPMKGG
jgi:hypothetical protein